MLDRAFRGRTTNWKEGELSLSTPDIIFIETESHPAPDFARSLLKETEEGRKLFSRGSSGEGPTLPSSFKFPLSHLKSLNLGMISQGVGATGVRSKPELIPDLLSASHHGIVSIEDAFELRRDARALVSTIVNIKSAVGIGC